MNAQVNGGLIGHARLAKYLKDCNQDLGKAEQLFRWNVQMSGAFYESLHLFEVLLRNAMDKHLGAWNALGGYSRDWLLTPDPRLEKLLSQKTLSTARLRANDAASKRGTPVIHDDVLAQMTFGTWRYLLPSNSSVPKQRLWTAALEGAFPRWDGQWEPLVKKVEIVHDIRNRVAHLESLHNENLRSARRAMRQVSAAISQQAGALYKSGDRTLPLIQQLEPIIPA